MNLPTLPPPLVSNYSKQKREKKKSLSTGRKVHCEKHRFYSSSWRTLCEFRFSQEAVKANLVSKANKFPSPIFLFYGQNIIKLQTSNSNLLFLLNFQICIYKKKVLFLFLPPCLWFVSSVSQGRPLMTKR